MAFVKSNWVGIAIGIGLGMFIVPKVVSRIR